MTIRIKNKLEEELIYMKEKGKIFSRPLAYRMARQVEVGSFRVFSWYSIENENAVDYKTYDSQNKK
jgi:hypothetical protein